MNGWPTDWPRRHRRGSGTPTFRAWGAPVAQAWPAGLPSACRRPRGGDAELEKAFRAWVAQVMLPRRFRGVAPESLPRLEEVQTMLEETVREWTADWVAEGREQGLEQGREQGLEQGREQGLEQGREQGLEQGLEQGRAEERALLCRLAARKFDAATGERLAAALADVTDAERLAEVGDWIIECGTEAELFARLHARRSGD